MLCSCWRSQTKRHPCTAAHPQSFFSFCNVLNLVEREGQHGQEHNTGLAQQTARKKFRLTFTVTLDKIASQKMVTYIRGNKLAGQNFYNANFIIYNSLFFIVYRIWI